LVTISNDGVLGARETDLGARGMEPTYKIRLGKRQKTAFSRPARNENYLGRIQRKKVLNTFCFLRGFSFQALLDGAFLKFTPWTYHPKP